MKNFFFEFDFSFEVILTIAYLKTLDISQTLHCTASLIYLILHPCWFGALIIHLCCDDICSKPYCNVRHKVPQYLCVVTRSCLVCSHWHSTVSWTQVLQKERHSVLRRPGTIFVTWPVTLGTSPWVEDCDELNRAVRSAFMFTGEMKHVNGLWFKTTQQSWTKTERKI